MINQLKALHLVKEILYTLNTVVEDLRNINQAENNIKCEENTKHKIKSKG